MPEPVSIAAGVCCLGYATLAAYARNGSAISCEATSARRSACAIVESVEMSHALFGGSCAAISELQTLADECGISGLDDRDAVAIDADALIIAERFIRLLPKEIQIPEFAAEPDGSISMDWTQSKHRRFSMSIGKRSRLAYAWLDGADKGHGVACFDGESIPPRILQGIASIMNHGDPFLRAA